MSEPSLANSPAATTPSILSSSSRLAIPVPPVSPERAMSIADVISELRSADGHHLLPETRSLHPCGDDGAGQPGQNRDRDEGRTHPGYVCEVAGGEPTNGV